MPNVEYKLLEKLDSENILLLARVYGWHVLWYRPEYQEFQFRRNDCDMTVWSDKMVVKTTLVHPRHGLTVLYRKNVDAELLEELLSNPRVHTKKGFRKK